MPDLRMRVALWLRPAVYLGQNALTLAGAVLTTSSAVTLLGFWFFEIVRGGAIRPYTGIVFFLILPGIFVLGLLLMPLGALWQRRKLQQAGQLPSTYPTIDLKRPRLRRAVSLVIAATALNALIMGVASYRGVEYMDSTQFCGQTCHSVMAPEFAAYQASPHSRVECVHCHIGPGAPWFVKAKISGVRQVLAVNLKTYSRPIPSPVRDLRPARDTCEQCHWPQRVEGDKFVVHTKYSDDEKNTPLTTVLVLKLGGRRPAGAVGIHGRHIDTVERIAYESDPKRQVIPRVIWTDDSGKDVEFVAAEANDPKPGAGHAAASERRKMDCMDCHNRPTHAFQLPERAVDQAMFEGRISAELPFVRKKAVEALRASYPDRKTAGDRIAQTLTDFYRTRDAETYRRQQSLVEAAVKAVQAVYLRNIFPEMNITWGTYPNNLGHEDFPGCFRCHDGNHKSSDGRVITQECDACHAILAQDEQNPKVLAELGLK
jgi:hypothetical protein